MTPGWPKASAPKRGAMSLLLLLLLGVEVRHRRRVAPDLDDGVRAGPPAARVDPAHGRHVVVVAAVADGDVALADLLGVGGVEGQPAPAGDGRLEPGVGL